jgi:outer membrane lipoprotein carrier protein
MGALLLLSLSWAVLASEPSAEANKLVQRLDALDGVISRFEQQITDAQGQLVEESRGQMHLLKPNFRWDVETPFAQIIVADGEQVRIYDPDLEQVTERDIQDNALNTPLTLLTQGGNQVIEQFDVGVEQIDATLAKFTLRPKASLSDSALFARLEVLFDGADLYALVFEDQIGQQTVIRFTEFAAQQVIQSELFQLQLPPDVDIVRG